MAALAVRYGGDLQLSQQQLDAILAVRERQDSVMTPLVRTLDSLRNGPRPVNPYDLSQEQREALAARRAAVKSALDAVRQSNEEARRQVMAVLSADQQAKTATLESAARELAREQGQRRANDGWFGGRSQMVQGMFRPPQG